MFDFVEHIEKIEDMERKNKERYGEALDEELLNYLEQSSPLSLSGDDGKEFKKLVELITKNNVRGK